MQHGNRERRQGGSYAQNPTTANLKGCDGGWKKTSEGPQGCRTERTVSANSNHALEKVTRSAFTSI